MFTRAFTISAVLSIAAAQLSGISSQCTQAITKIATNADVTKCLNPSPLLPIVTGSNTTSVVTPVDNWLTSVCSLSPCSNDTIAAIVNNATAGCSTELASIGYQSGDNSGLISIIQQYYPAVRQIACLKDGNTLCVTETLTDLQNVFGTLSINSLPGIITGSVNGQSVPQNVTCSNCAKAAYNIAQQSAPNLIITQQDAQTECGSSFVDGQDPSGITKTATNTASASSSGNNGAVSLASVPGATALFALLSTFAALA